MPYFSPFALFVYLFHGRVGSRKFFRSNSVKVERYYHRVAAARHLNNRSFAELRMAYSVAIGKALRHTGH